MLFSKERKLTRYEYSLVNGFLRETIGVSKPWCCEVLDQEGFTIIDQCKSKVGFVKEGDGKVFILTLHFQNQHSHNYHLIIKNENEKWSEKRVINFKYLKELGLV